MAPRFGDKPFFLRTLSITRIAVIDIGNMMVWMYFWLNEENIGFFHSCRESGIRALNSFPQAVVT